jgi:hypothetical protein
LELSSLPPIGCVHRSRPWIGAVRRRPLRASSGTVVSPERRRGGRRVFQRRARVGPATRRDRRCWSIAPLVRR